MAIDEEAQMRAIKDLESLLGRMPSVGADLRDVRHWNLDARNYLQRYFGLKHRFYKEFDQLNKLLDGDADLNGARLFLGQILPKMKAALASVTASPEATSSPGPQKGTASLHQTIKVFISHSSRDVELAGALIELLRSATGLLASQIRCSSVDGYRLGMGVETGDQLRVEVNITEVFIGLITPSSLASDFVMFELGARWGADRFLAPLLAGIEPGEVKPPLSFLNALSANNDSQLHQMTHDIAAKLSLPLQPSASFLKHIDTVRGLAQATATTKVAPTIERIVGHSYVDGMEDEICHTCAVVNSLKIPLIDADLDGRGKKATCPRCKIPVHQGPPILRQSAQATERRRAEENR